MDWFPLNYMSPKVIVKMHRKGKGWFSSPENGPIQPILKPTQIFIHCHSSHKNHNGNWKHAQLLLLSWAGVKSQKTERCVWISQMGEAFLLLLCFSAGIIEYIGFENKLERKTTDFSLLLLFYFSPEENGFRKSHAAFELHGCQGQHLLTWIRTHALDQFMRKSAINMQFCRCKFSVGHPLYEYFQLIHSYGWLRRHTQCFSHAVGIRSTTKRMSNVKYAREDMKWKDNFKKVVQRNWILWFDFVSSKGTLCFAEWRLKLCLFFYASYGSMRFTGNTSQELEETMMRQWKEKLLVFQWNNCAS